MEDNHRNAAQKLADALGWGRNYFGGSLPNHAGTAWVKAVDFARMIPTTTQED